MNNKPELIVMLTYNDFTVENAYEIFEQCKNSKAKIWGFKEQGLPIEKMKELFSYMKKYNKQTVLEVVAYTEEKCMEGAIIAKKCGCDMLIGTLFFDSVNEYCKENNIKYMPFVGHVSGRPSILEGNANEILNEANEYLKKGVYGINVLGYRYTGDIINLNNLLVSKIKSPVCIAGSINSYQKLDEIKKINPNFFTIGTAFFENKFGGSFKEQIDKVCNYIELSQSDIKENIKC